MFAICYHGDHVSYNQLQLYSLSNLRVPRSRDQRTTRQLWLVFFSFLLRRENDLNSSRNRSWRKNWNEWKKYTTGDFRGYRGREKRVSRRPINIPSHDNFTKDSSMWSSEKLENQVVSCHVVIVTPTDAKFLRLD